jgi:predicted small metal-binding protein
MIRFKEYVLLKEAKFRKSKKVVHLKDYPMFSLFYDKDLGEDKISYIRKHRTKYLNGIGEFFKEARRQITSMGFPSMHSNVVIMDLSERYNKNTGIQGDVGGYSSKHYMALDYRHANAETIVHEWAHDYMRKKSKAFKKAVDEYYRNKIKNVSVEKQHLLPNEYSDIDKFTRYTNYMKNVVDEISKRIGYLKSEDIVKLYVANKIKLTKENISKILPHRTTTPLTLKDETRFYMVGRRYESIIVPSLSQVQLWNAGNNWFVTFYNKDGAYDMNENGNTFDEVIKYFVEDEKEVIKKIKQKIKDRNSIYSNIEEDVKNKILSNFKTAVEKAFDNILIDARNDLSKQGIQINTYTKKKEIDAKIKNYAKETVDNIIFPKFLKIAKNFLSITNIYDELWVSNEFKSRDNSFSKFLYPLFLDLIPYEMPKQLSGGQYNNLRSIIQSMNVWHSSYGLSNEDEIWATAIDNFFNLPIQTRREIVSLMMVN